jgi:putative colanic acid biosynthesis acetyltransferase WcaF
MVDPSNTTDKDTPPVDLSAYRNRLGFRNKLLRAVWGLVWLVLYRPSPRPCHGWRRFLLRCFGATIGPGAKPYPTARIWAPWNLDLGAHAWLGDGVDCYSVGPIRIGASAIVSQRAFLCSATHDYTDPGFPLVTAPVMIGPAAWVAAEAFVGPGVTVGDGAVVAARACVVRDVEAWTVVAGNPARVVKKRELRSSL